MDEMENRLRGALRRKAAPAGFAARVLSRVEGEAACDPTPRREQRRPHWRFFRPRVWAVAAALVLATGLGLIENDRRIDRRNRAALAQALSALSLAAEQLERAQDKAFTSPRWEDVAKRLASLPVPRAEPPRPGSHSKAGGPRI